MPRGKVSSSAQASRRGLFRRLAGHPGALAPRPPWAVAEDEFLDCCDRCGACIEACGPGILFRVRGYPEVSFQSDGCTFCGDCVRACPTGALDRDALAVGRPPWTRRAKVGEGCLAVRGVVCRVCGEQCEAGAIRFRLAPGGRGRPEIGPECTGCGMCVAPCPVNAVVVTADERGSQEKRCA